MIPAELRMDFAGPGTGTGGPITTAFVYIAAPLADPGFQLDATPAVASTPEPTSILIMAFAFGLIVLCHTRKRKNASRSIVLLPNP
jgi:hypothetical protein